MKVVFKYIIFTVVILHYLVGSIGFTIHHCCCSKLYHTTSLITEVFSPYHYNCKRIQEAKEDFGLTVFRPYRHCGSVVYSMDKMKYNNEEKLQSPPLLLFEIENFNFYFNSLLISQLESNTFNNSHIFYNCTLKRRCLDADSLCTFLI